MFCCPTTNESVHKSAFSPDIGIILELVNWQLISVMQINSMNVSRGAIFQNHPSCLNDMKMTRSCVIRVMFSKISIYENGHVVVTIPGSGTIWKNFSTVTPNPNNEKIVVEFIVFPKDILPSLISNATVNFTACAFDDSINFQNFKIPIPFVVVDYRLARVRRIFSISSNTNTMIPQTEAKRLAWVGKTLEMINAANFREMLHANTCIHDWYTKLSSLTNESSVPIVQTSATEE